MKEKKIASHVFFHQSRRSPLGKPDLTNLRPSIGTVTVAANVPWHQKRTARSYLASPIHIKVSVYTIRSNELELSAPLTRGAEVRRYRVRFTQLEYENRQDV
jgi:hypothetical protein